MSETSASAAPILRAILIGQVRHLLTAAGAAAIAHGVAEQGAVDTAVPPLADYLVGIIMVAGSMIASALAKGGLGRRLRAAWAVLVVPAPAAAAPPPAPAAASASSTEGASV